MSSPGDAGRAEAVRDRYRQVFGTVPAGIEIVAHLADAGVGDAGLPGADRREQ